MRRSAGLLAMTILMLGALAWSIGRAQIDSREILNDRFESRVEAGSGFIREFIRVRQSEELAVAHARFSGRKVDPEAFNLAVQALGFEAAVLLDEEGRVLAVYPKREDIIGDEIASRYAHLSSAVRGDPAVSGVVPSAARGVPVVAAAMPYDTPHGRRVFSGAFSVEVGPLGNFLRDVLPFETANLFLVDDDGDIAATSGFRKVGFRSLRDVDPDLFAAVSRAGSVRAVRGATESDGRAVRYVSEPIQGTTWALVANVDAGELYEPIARGSWPGWLVFAGLMATAGFAIHLVRRLEQSQREVADRLAEQERLNTALESFSSRTAHDLRSPLAVVKMCVETLGKADLSPEDRARMHEVLNRQTDSALTLIEDLLDLARASGTARPEAIALRELLDNIQQEHPGVEVRIGEVPETIQADPVSFKQAVVNLIRNASVHGASDGRAIVEVSGERVNGTTVVSLADRGPGLTPEQSSAVFEPFVRGPNPRKTGSGLGLSIVGAMAQAHGGRAWYEDRPGGGAVFKIAIPDRAER